MAFKRRILISNLATDGYNKQWVKKKDTEEYEIQNKEICGYQNISHVKGWFTENTSEQEFWVSSGVYEKELCVERITTETDDPQYTKLYCTCDYEGEAKLIGEKQNGKEYEYYKYKPIFACPNCEKEPEHIFAKWMHDAEAVMEYVDILDNRGVEGKKSTISLSWAITKYYFNQKSLKLAAKNEQFRIIFNIETGMAYLFTPNRKVRLRNITYGFIGSHSLRKEFRYFSECVNEEQSETVKKYIQLLMKLRGIKYKTVKQIASIYDNELPCVWNVIRALPYLRFPQLQHVQSCDYNWLLMPEYIRIRLNVAENKVTDVYKALTGFGSKKIRMMDIEGERLGEMIFWGMFVKKQDNLIKLLDSFYADDGIWKPKNLFQDTFYGKHGIKAMRFILALHHDENTFVNCLIKLGERTATYQIHDLLSYLKDIANMYKGIKIRAEDYQIKYKNNLWEYHDKLSRDYNRIKVDKTDIKYMKKELQNYEKEIDTFQFVLAKDNHELIEVGTNLNICVGSYGERAVERKTTIVFMKSEEVVDVCIEIKKIDKQMRLMQTKTSRNHYPNYQQALAIQKWCKQAGINSTHCYDLESVLKKYKEEQKQIEEFIEAI